ncbi:hypothetical protein HN388_02165 [bacterium]|jgi:hypothetical protein|nr:hypothetical protein [bacterium]
MKKLLVLSLLLVAVNAFAFPGGDDTLGLYTDMELGVNTLTTTTPFEAVELYVLLTNPTYTGASGYEFQIITEGAITAPAWNLEGIQPLNVFAAPLFAVGLGEGNLAIYPNEFDACHLVTYSAFVLAPGDIVNFYIAPLESGSWDPANIGYADALNAGNLPTAVPSSGAFEFNIFSINGLVADEAVSFGAVKALFN